MGTGGITTTISFGDETGEYLASGSRPLPAATPATLRLLKGEMFHCSTLVASLANNANLDMSLTTPAGEAPHMVIEAACGGSADLLFYEGSTVSDGVVEVVPNHMRTSLTVWTGVVRTAPTVSATGTLLSSQFMPGGQRNQATGAAASFGLEWVLKPSTTYLIRLVNRSGAAQGASIGCDHYTEAT